MSSFRSMDGIGIKVMGRRYTVKPLNYLGCVIITGKASTCCQRKTNYSENLTSLTSFRLPQYPNRVFVLNNLQPPTLQPPTLELFNLEPRTLQPRTSNSFLKGCKGRAFWPMAKTGNGT